MRRFYVVPFALCLLAAGPAAAPRAETHVVRIGDAETRALVASHDGELVRFGLTRDQRQNLRELSGGRVDLLNLYRVRLDPHQDATKIAASTGYLGKLGPAVPPFSTLGRDGKITGTTLGVTEADAAVPPPAETPMDPVLADQWWVPALKAPEAWRYGTGRGVTIADCDTGFFLEEPDLGPNMMIERRYDFSDLGDPLNVDHGPFVFHGTAVAAIMTGVRDGAGTNGLAYEAKLVPLQNFNYDRDVDDVDKEEATARCILHAVRLGDVDVIVVQNQTSAGSSETFAGTREAIELAVESGISVVSAAGNASVELVTEERHDSGSIIVGALRQNGRAANYSNFGPRVTVSAFGENLRTLYGPDGRIDAFGGTTGAAAQVGAAVALMLSANRDLTPWEVRTILQRTRATSELNVRVGGMLDIGAAVRAASMASPNRDGRARALAFRKKAAAILRGD